MTLRPAESKATSRGGHDFPHDESEKYIVIVMETDSFFYQLLKQLPETLFALLGEPLTRAADYRFDALEVKKSYRLDGLFVPARTDLPVYFVEVQFQRARAFYANLFAKVFSYLEANDPDQEWMAVALFPSRAAEPKRQEPYEDLLASPRVRRIYLNELKIAGGAPPGLAILQLATATQNETPELVSRLLAPGASRAGLRTGRCHRKICWRKC